MRYQTESGGNSEEKTIRTRCNPRRRALHPWNLSTSLLETWVRCLRQVALSCSVTRNTGQGTTRAQEGRVGTSRGNSVAEAHSRLEQIREEKYLGRYSKLNLWEISLLPTWNTSRAGHCSPKTKPTRPEHLKPGFPSVLHGF